MRRVARTRSLSFVPRADVPGWQRYGVALLVTIAALAARIALVPLVGSEFTFLLAYPAVTISAWYGGVGPGMLSMALSVFNAMVFLEPLSDPSATLVRAAVFCVSAVVISLLSESLRRARRRAEAETLRGARTERMLATSQELAHVGSWELDLADIEDVSRNQLRWSDETFRIFGYAPGEVDVTNELFFDRVHPGDRQRIVEAVTAALRDRTAYQIDHRIVRPDGVERHVREWGTVVSARSGRPRGVLGTCQDVTESVRAEGALREREHLLGVITDAAPALIAYVDTDFRYRMANRTYQRWFGHDPARMKNRHVRDVLGEAAWTALRPYMKRALAGEEVVYEEELHYGDSGARWVSVTYSPDRKQSGDVRGFVVLVHDISDRKAAEMAEQRARAEAETSNRAKDQFLAVLSHELRTPLTPVLGAAAMLESRPGHLPEDIRRLVSLIRKNAELEARLIDDLLDLTRVSRGKLSLHLEPIDAHETIDDVLRACESDLEAKQLRLKVTLGARDHNVLADQARFQQVIWNVVKNAVKFSHPAGQITVQTKSNGDGKFSLEVTDEGIGIDPDLLPRVFNAFEQGSRELTRHFGGLGLGLAIGKALIEAQGGSVHAASPGPDRGSTFTVAIPLARVAPSASVPEADPARPTADRRRILLVEDHIDTSLLLAEILELQGYRVRTAETVADALRLADTEQFDLVLSDIGLPDGTGHDLMRQLRARHKLSGVALSGYGLEKDVREAKTAGFSEHLTKPVNPTYLLEVLNRVIEARP